MKTIFHAIGMAFSMFSAIPFPWHGWDEKARPLMLCFLPLVGLTHGLLWALLAFLLRLLEMPSVVSAFFLAAFPYAVSGHIHLDGFMDVTDAVRSCRPLEERRRILKDSRVGSFAVIGCVLVLLGSFAFFAASASDADFHLLILIPVESRCCSALAVMNLPPMHTSQYANAVRKGENVGKSVVLIVILAVCVAAGFLFDGLRGLVSPALLIGYAVALRGAYRSLAGMNGDISGFSIVVAELCGIAAFSIL